MAASTHDPLSCDNIIVHFPSIHTREGPQSKTLIDHRNVLHNQLLQDMAAKYGLDVQHTSLYLASRYDAHLWVGRECVKVSSLSSDLWCFLHHRETRNTNKNNVLDCTHW